MVGLLNLFELFSEAVGGIDVAGIPQRVIDTWLGHRSDRSMGSVYYRLSDTDSRAFMEKVPFGPGLAVSCPDQDHRAG